MVPLSPVHQNTIVVEILVALSITVSLSIRMEHLSLQQGTLTDNAHPFFSVTAGELLELCVWPLLDSACEWLLRCTEPLRTERKERRAKHMFRSR